MTIVVDEDEGGAAVLATACCDVAGVDAACDIAGVDVTASASDSVVFGSLSISSSSSDIDSSNSNLRSLRHWSTPPSSDIAIIMRKRKSNNQLFSAWYSVGKKS